MFKIIYYYLCLQTVTKEHVVEMDLLEPILELLESDDITVQGNSCACLMMLADSGEQGSQKSSLR